MMMITTEKPVIESDFLSHVKCFSKEALRSIVISQRLLGTTKIAIFHHTDCGMLAFTDDMIRRKIKSEEPGNAVVAEAVDKIDFLTFPRLEESIQDDVNFLKGCSLLKKGTELSGWIYDVHTGKIIPVTETETL